MFTAVGQHIIYTYHIYLINISVIGTGIKKP